MNAMVSLRAEPRALYETLLRAGVLYVAMTTLAWLAIRYSYHVVATGFETDLVSTVWASDAVLLACLLSTPRRQWGLYILAGLLGNATANFISSPRLIVGLYLSFCSILSAIGAAMVLRRSRQAIDLTRRNDLIKFALAAGLLGPILSAAFATAYLRITQDFPIFVTWRSWFLEHALGFIIVTPPLLAVNLHDLRQAFHSKERVGLLTALAIVAVTAAVVFWQNSYPVLFLIFPTLTFAAFRCGFVGASLGTLLTAVITISMTLAGHGPLMLMHGDFGEKILVLQVLLAIIFLSSMPIAVALTEVRRFQQEMTAARQDLAEQNRLLQLAEQTANVGHWRLDLRTSKLFWSDETYRIHGRDKSDYTPDPNAVFADYHPDDFAKIRLAGERAFNNLENTDLMLRILRPDGEVRYVRSLGKYEFDPDGKARTLFGVVHDITDMKRAEQALIDALEEARRASRAKSDFLASMSHELRTPLNAVIGFSQLLLHHPKERLSAQQAEYLGYVLRGGNHLLQLVKDVLDLATIESGRLRVSIEAVDLVSLLEELESTLTPLAQEKGLTFEPIVLPAALPLVRADRGRLLQVLLNLGSNAIKYNRPNGALRVFADRAAGGRVRISISDTGKGIAADRQAELFQPFNRLGSENSAIEGTGIGLSICQRLMDLMSGAIGFTSAPGVGSTFWIEIEEAEALARGAGNSEIMLAKPAPLPPELRLNKILYIDDNPSSVALMARLVETLPGVTFLSAHTGDLGVQLAIAHTPDLIVVDIHLPDISGYDVLQRLRSAQETAQLPIVALSSAAMPKDLERGRSAGFNAYLTKPFAVADMIDVFGKAAAQTNRQAAHG